MKLNDFIKKIAKTLGKSVRSIRRAVMHADLIGLIKFGILIGVSVTVVVLLFKYIKMKWKAYQDPEEKTVVDEALGENYSDIRNQEELHPLMKKVRKSLRKELKPRTKVNGVKENKKMRKKREAYEEAYADLENKLKDFDEDLYDENNDPIGRLKNLFVTDKPSKPLTNEEVLELLKTFKQDMNDVEAKERYKRAHPTASKYSLRQVWEG